MRLDAWSLSTLQDVAAVLRFAQNAGLDLPTVLSAIEASVNQSFDTQAGTLGSPQLAAKCPSCGRKSLLPAAQIEGINRYGCRECYYSTIAEDK